MIAIEVPFVKDFRDFSETLKELHQTETFHDEKPSRQGKCTAHHRIRNDADQCFFEQCFIHTILSRFEKRQHNHRHNIIKWYTSYDHKWCLSGITIDILDKCNSKKRRTASVRSLDEFSLDASVFQQAGDSNCDRDTDQCDNKTENYEFRIPRFLDIYDRQIAE